VQEPIFDIVNKDKEFSNSILSFKDCPNKCRDGYYINPYSHKRVKCTYCENLRKQLASEKVTVDGESIEKILKLPFSLSNSKVFDINVTIPEFSKKKMIPSSVEKMSSLLQNLISDISIGVASDYSILFNLGALCHEENFVYAYMVRAYMSGLTVSPYYSSHDIVLLRNNSESTNYREEDKRAYDDLLNTDVCIILVETGASHDAITATMGVVQLRAFHNKSTIVFTKVSPKSGKFNSYICSEENKCREILTYYTVEFTEKYEEQETKYNNLMSSNSHHNNMKGLTGNGFSNLTSPRNNL
jgi:hypothetical protein